MKHADKEKLRLRAQWIRDNPEHYEKQITETWVYIVDKFYSCDGEKLRLRLFLPIKAVRPIELFPEDLRDKRAPILSLLSCDDSALIRYFKVGEDELARETYNKIIEMQPISFKELEEMGFINE
jgi:hypothetical protein